MAEMVDLFCASVLIIIDTALHKITLDRPDCVRAVFLFLRSQRNNLRVNISLKNQTVHVFFHVIFFFFVSSHDALQVPGG